MNIKQITISLTLGATLGILPTLFHPLMAQTAQDLGTFQRNERDPNSGSLGDFNPMQLMHQLQLSNGRSMTDFMLDTNRNIDSAASDFREQQKQIILQQTSKNNEDNLVETEPTN
jgi:hypothetical protein